MTHKQETGMAIIMAVVLLLLILLSSCSTKKTVTEYVTVHDTLTIHHSDTLKIIRETRDTIVDWKSIILRDTVRYEKERVIVVDEKGDTLNQREVEKLWQKINELESTHHDESHNDNFTYLKAQNDSLRAALKAQENKKEVKTIKRPQLWEFGVLIASCMLFYLCILFVIKNSKNRKDKNI